MLNFDKLKELRKKNNMNQTELAKIANISQRQISSYENGKETPSIETLVNIAKHFKVSLEYLIGLPNTNTAAINWAMSKAQKRLNLLDHPIGKFEFNYYLNGKEQTSVFEYTFGIFPKKYKISSSSKESSIFFDEFEQAYSNIFLLLKEENNNYIDYLLNSPDNISFLALINHLNTTLEFDYPLDFDNAGERKSNLLLYNNQCNNYYISKKLNDKQSPSIIKNKFLELSSGSGKPIFLTKINPIYELYVNDFINFSLELKKELLNDFKSALFTY